MFTLLDGIRSFFAVILGTYSSLLLIRGLLFAHVSLVSSTEIHNQTFAVWPLPLSSSSCSDPLFLESTKSPDVLL
jgi:hypothetical protein